MGLLFRQGGVMFPAAVSWESFWVRKGNTGNPPPGTLYMGSTDPVAFAGVPFWPDPQATGTGPPPDSTGRHARRHARRHVPPPLPAPKLSGYMRVRGIMGARRADAVASTALHRGRQTARELLVPVAHRASGGLDGREDRRHTEPARGASCRCRPCARRSCSPWGQFKAPFSRGT